MNVLSSPPLPLPRPLLLLRSEHTMQPTRTPLASPVPARPRTSFRLKGASVSEGEGEECCGCGEGVSTYTDGIVKLWSHSSTHTHFTSECNHVTSLPCTAEADMNRQFLLPHTTKIAGDQPTLSLREIVDRLDNVYCGTIGVEYMHIHEPVKRDWIR